MFDLENPLSEILAISRKKGEGSELGASSGSGYKMHMSFVGLGMFVNYIDRVAYRISLLWQCRGIVPVFNLFWRERWKDNSFMGNSLTQTRMEVTMLMSITCS